MNGDATAARAIVVRPVAAARANALIRRVHYSGRIVRNSQLHLGVFLGGRLHGAMQFGPSMDKRKIAPLVDGTPWNGFIELNRMAFTDALPRNSESRALGVALRMIRRHAPHIGWVVSFADATLSGDGTIYRAAGFVLTGIKRNTQIWRLPDGSTTTGIVAEDTRGRGRGALLSRMTVTKGGHIRDDGGASMRPFVAAGARPLPGFQLRYIYFLDPTARDRLTVPVLDYGAIGRAGASMYRGVARHAPEASSDAPVVQTGEGGPAPTPALHLAEAAS